MIGQLELKKRITDLIESDKYPRFSIFVGAEGSGKKTLSKFVASFLGATRVLSGIGVDDVREVISTAYKISAPVVYVLADADMMSPAAKNALLKVTEEPPKNAYFILTITDLSTTLDTIKSRGIIFNMEPYTVNEIDAYYHDNIANNNVEVRQIVDNICSNPGEVNQVVDMNAVEFYKYTEKVVDNIAQVSGANSFKIGDKIKFKESDTDKYDLKLFFRAFMVICSDRLRSNPMHYSLGITVTSKYLQETRITGINKQSLFDMWLLDIREAWM